MFRPFGQWLPDLPEHDHPGLVTAQNVRPWFNGTYRPFPNLGSAVSTALTARARGAIAVVGNDGATRAYAGDIARLYEIWGGVASNVSIAAGYDLGAEDGWEFAYFNNKVLAASIGSVTQSFTPGTSTLFANLATSTLTPRARHIAPVGRFVVLGNVEESGTRYTNRLRWSGFDDETTYDQSAATMSDFQDLKGDFGWIQKVIGGEYGIVISERAIHRMTFVGSPLVFEILPVELNRGTIASGSVVQWGNHVYYLDWDGFYDFNGAASTSISHGKVSKWFFDNWSATYKHRITAAIDPVNSLVVWAFPSSSVSGSDPNPDSLLLYHWPSGGWARISNVTTEILFQGLKYGQTLDQLDTISASLDDLPYSLDSRVYAGGDVALAAIDSSGQKFFDGANLEAVLDTGRMQLFDGERALMTAFWPRIDGGTITGQIAGTELPSATATFPTPALTIEDDGALRDTISARFHKIRTTVAAGGTWNFASGLQIEAQPDGAF